MKWPWPGKRPTETLVVACDDHGFAYVQAEAGSALQRRISRCGVLPRGDDSLQDYARRIRALGLPARQVTAVLPLAKCQLLQIEAPGVPPEELKAAARWRIKDLVETHLDDLTLDVMHVGDERPRTQKHVFVAAAANSAIAEVTGLLAAVGMTLQAIDIRETAQRNLQSALAQTLGLRERATAVLMVHGAQCLLTISANDELFYTRRLDWDESSVAAAAAPAGVSASAVDVFSQPLHALDGTDMPDIVDYGAEPEAGSAQTVDVPRLVVELQRSFDVWERSWPELPLASVVVEASAHSAALAGMLERELGLRVEALDLARVFSGLDTLADTDRASCLPLLGALLRSETRKP